MNDDVFAQTVASDVKNKINPGQKAYLRLPENVQRWQKGLFALIENLEIQLEELSTAEQEAIDRYTKLGSDGEKLLEDATNTFADRRQNIARFRFHVDKRVDEATRLLAANSENADERANTVEFFRHAIQKHKELIDSFQMDYSDVDEALWATITGQWNFDEIEKEL